MLRRKAFLDRNSGRFGSDYGDSVQLKPRFSAASHKVLFFKKKCFIEGFTRRGHKIPPLDWEFFAGGTRLFDSNLPGMFQRVAMATLSKLRL